LVTEDIAKGQKPYFFSVEKIDKEALPQDPLVTKLQSIGDKNRSVENPTDTTTEEKAMALLAALEGS
jgi:hypothetical protein